MRRIPIGLLGLALLGTFAPRVSHAYDDAEQAGTYAVQNRAFQLKHELNASGGVLPLNAFVKGLTFGGGYTYHFSDLWAWEVAQFMYAKGLDTDLRDELMSNFTPVAPTLIESVEYLGSTSVVVKPFYGKFALLNQSVVHAEMFFVLGAGFVKMKPSAFRPGPDFGAGMRFHLGGHWSLRFDVRDYVLFKDITKGLSAKNELWLALSIALSLGGDSK